ncbi:hypothetical protein PO909_002504, partial [Leuciscus waleckii]
MLMESRHRDVWSRHRSSQIVPHIISHSCCKVAGLRGAVIMVILILWLNNISIDQSEIVKHSAARNNLRHEGRAHLQGLEEDTAPACLQHPK